MATDAVDYQPGDVVCWYERSRPAGWHFGRFVRTIARGRHKGDAEVSVGGDITPARTVRVPADRMRRRPGKDVDPA